VRHLPLQLHPEAEHLIDWFRLTRRVTVLGQYVKRLICLDQALGAVMQKKLESVK
jgi:hypothetical protein